MALTAGIVGLPNVGKSTLFNAITNSKIEAANYPFATIEPNVGIVEVPDERIEKIASIVGPEKCIKTTFEFTDIAGLVKGASKGEGLGNQFLGNIRQVDAICHVVRCFTEEDITHVDGDVNPIRDIETINLELIFSDLETVEKRAKRLAKMAQMKDKDAAIEHAALLRLIEAFEQGKPARSVELSDLEAPYIHGLHLITQKPVIYIANISEDEVAQPSENEQYQAVVDFAKEEGAQVIPICARIEAELSELSKEERQEFLEDLGIKESGLDKVIRSAYTILGLQTYFTAGVKEVRAWTFKKGMKAPQCAGVIHTDFEKGFIRAETFAYEDLCTYGSESAVKEAGKLRLEGKEYQVQDGDIMHFRFNV